MEMKDELQGKLVEILTSMQTAAGKASDFAMEQLPDIAQSYVAYGRAYHSTWVVLMALLLLGIAILSCRGYRKAKTDPASLDHMPPTFAFVIGGIASVLPFIALVDSMKPALMLWIAPKVWLLQEIARLVR